MTGVNTTTLQADKSSPPSHHGAILELAAKGWQVSLTTAHHFDAPGLMQISISRDDWHDLTVPGYEYAFLAHSQNEAEVLNALHRLIALDTAMTETFHDTFPSQCVDSDGWIRTDTALTEHAKLGQRALLEHLMSRRREPTAARTSLDIARGFIRLRTTDAERLLSVAEIEALQEAFCENDDK